jgi:hypothetical protein
MENNDNVLRFGDVLKGYVFTAPNIVEPISNVSNTGCKIEIDFPFFSVVITPCCSIGQKTISLTPLIEIRNTFFRNPHFSEDLTRINRKMEPQQGFPPKAWKKLSPEEKKRRLEEGCTYVFLELFVYEKNDLFSKYSIHINKQENIETNYYMIDFKNTYKLNCEKINTPKDAPIASKCLQLSIQARKELRDKIAYYYGRTPKEYKILED